MKIKSLIIALAITLSSAIQANPFSWIYEKIRNHPYITATAVITAAGAYYRITYNSNDLDQNEGVNSSPVTIGKEAIKISPIPLEDKNTLFYPIQNDSESIAQPNAFEQYRAFINGKKTTRIDPRTKPIRSCMKGSRLKELNAVSQDIVQ
jgi:hypothetical protein